MLRPTLYTLGYQERTVEDFIDLLTTARIDTVVDVRATAWSHKRGFSRSALERHLRKARIAYIHAAFAGNPKFLRSVAPTHNDCLRLYRSYFVGHHEIVEEFANLIAGLQAYDQRVCLVCYERHAQDCHRSILTEKWRALGARSVEHLAVSGCKRLVGQRRRG